MASVVEKELYDAALKGDVTTSLQLLQQDPYLVERVSFSCSRNLLHVATMRGQALIVAEVLKVNPQLARNLDSQNLSPLHIAAAQGNVEVAKILLSVAPEMCWWRDGQGMNPVHIAAMSGHVEVLQELIRHDSLPAMERVHRGQTVLHLCAKHRQLAVLKVLMESLGHELVPANDDDGYTLLDSAVRSNQIDMIKYLVEEVEINKDAMESMKGKALDLLKQGPPGTNGSEVKKLLRVTFNSAEVIESSAQLSSTVMVVAVLIAAMAFQAAVSPPGGVWQEDTSSHKAGDAVMASTHPSVHKLFVGANTIAFVLCLFAITVLCCGGPFKMKSAGIIGLGAIFYAKIFILISYGASLIVVTPKTETGHVRLVCAMAFLIFLGLMPMVYVMEVIMWRDRLSLSDRLLRLRNRIRQN